MTIDLSVLRLKPIYFSEKGDGYINPNRALGLILNFENVLGVCVHYSQTVVAGSRVGALRMLNLEVEQECSKSCALSVDLDSL